MGVNLQEVDGGSKDVGKFKHLLKGLVVDVLMLEV